MVKDDLYYTKEHEWVKIDNKEAVFGISDHAQRELGDITFVEVPEPEACVQQAQSFATIESVKAASDVYAPLSGRIVAVNEALQDTPEKVNSSPYDEGWICRVKIDDLTEKDFLMNSDDYKSYLEDLA